MKIRRNPLRHENDYTRKFEYMYKKISIVFKISTTKYVFCTKLLFIH